MNIDNDGPMDLELKSYDRDDFDESVWEAQWMDSVYREYFINMRKIYLKNTTTRYHIFNPHLQLEDPSIKKIFLAVFKDEPTLTTQENN